MKFLSLFIHLNPDFSCCAFFWVPVLVCAGCRNKVTQAGWLTQLSFCTVQKARSPKSKVLSGVRALFLACGGRPRAVSSRGLSWVCVSRGRAELSGGSLIRTLILSDQGPTLMTSFNLHYSLRSPVPKYGRTGDSTYEYSGSTNMYTKTVTYIPVQSKSTFCFKAGLVDLCSGNLHFPILISLSQHDTHK